MLTAERVKAAEAEGERIAQEMVSALDAVHYSHWPERGEQSFTKVNLMIKFGAEGASGGSSACRTPRRGRGEASGSEHVSHDSIQTDQMVPCEEYERAEAYQRLVQSAWADVSAVRAWGRSLMWFQREDRYAACSLALHLVSRGVAVEDATRMVAELVRVQGTVF